MARENASTPVEPRIGLESGEQAVLTLADVAVAALDTLPDSKYDVLVEVGGRNRPALPLVRAALGGRDPRNTNAAEMALRALGFSILVRRRFDDAAGEPVRLSREQIKASSP